MKVLPKFAPWSSMGDQRIVGRAYSEGETTDNVDCFKYNSCNKVSKKVVCSVEVMRREG